MMLFCVLLTEAVTIQHKDSDTRLIVIGETMRERRLQQVRNKGRTSEINTDNILAAHTDVACLYLRGRHVLVL